MDGMRAITLYYVDSYKAGRFCLSIILVPYAGYTHLNYGIITKDNFCLSKPLIELLLCVLS